MARITAWIEAFALSIGAPGLFIIAFLDSSFLSFPEVGDILVVALTIQHPGRWWYYGLATTAGSVLGCYVLYALARKGGDAFIRRRFSAKRIERGLAVFRRVGLLAIIVPSILPPPTPFKIFVLLAGIAGVRPVPFVVAIAIGRGFRYVGEAWLAYEYGDRATEYISNNLRTVSIWAAVIVGVLGVALIVFRSWMAKRDAAS